MPNDAAAMTHEPGRGRGVHAPELLDRLQQKEQQDQAYNEIHCVRLSIGQASCRSVAAPDLRFPLRSETYANFTRSRICDSKSRAAGVARRLPGQRRVAACGIGRRRAQKRREPRGGARVEGAVSPAGQAGDFAERAPRRRILSLLEHERLHAEERELAGEAASVSGFSSIASPMKTSAPTLARLASSRAWASTSPDLGRSAAHVDAAHELREPLPAGDEVRRPAFVQAAEIDELHVEAAERAGGLEHFRLQRLGEVPGRLPAHGRVEGEDQPSAAGRRRRGNLFRRLDEGGDGLAAVSPRQRAVLVLVQRRHLSVCSAA